MSIVAPIQTRFDVGEVSPLLYGRIDSDRYKAALALCKNWIPFLQGPLGRRPATFYIGSIKDSASPARLVPFKFSTTQAYMLEFGYTGGAGYIRFYADYGIVGISPLEVAHPYSGTEIFELGFVQSADVLYLLHPNHAPMKLERFSSLDWQLVKMNIQDGPYLPIENVVLGQYQATLLATTGSTTIQMSAINLTITGAANNGSGLIRIACSSTFALESGQTYSIANIVGTTEANGVWRINVVDNTHFDLIASAFVHAYVSGGDITIAPFSATDVGRSIRVQGNNIWGWGIITAFNNVTKVTYLTQQSPGSTTIDAWTLGVWSATTGYPSTGVFHQDRLVLGGNKNFPQRFDGSVTSGYENFAPSLFDGTVIASNAISFSLNSNDVNLIAWLDTDEKSLLAGTVSGEWPVRASTLSEAITPTNVNASRSTSWGSALVSSLKVAKAVMFVQRGARKLRELLYYFDIDGYRSVDLTELAEHITKNGINQIAYQSLPTSIVWATRTDGALLGMTYDRDLGQLRVAWHQHTLGGKSDSAGSIPAIESIAVIPNPQGTFDDLWMIVRRQINGATVRYIEVLDKIFEDIDLQQNANFLDCSSTYDQPQAIQSISKANPAVVQCAAHGLVTGDKVRIDGVFGMTELNGKFFTATSIDFNHYSLNGIDSTNFGTYIIGGQSRKMVTAISGLGYLEGELVSVYADSCEQPSKTVSGGSITLDQPAAVVTVGFAYQSDGMLLRPEAGARNGTAIGKNRRIHRYAFMIHRGLGLKAGKDFNNLMPLQYRIQGDDTNSQPVGLHSGIVSMEADFDYDFENQICFRVEGPFPCVLQAIATQMETQDRA